MSANVTTETLGLHVRDLDAGYGAATVIREVSFDVAAGEALAVVGRNGMGKTTLLKAIMGHAGRTTGTVRVGDSDVTGRPAHRIVRLGVGYAAQEGNLFTDLTVAENLQAATMHLPRGHTAKRREEVLAYFPVLTNRLWQTAGTLSGGEQKMLVLSLALLREPRLLIIDEISDGLQPSVVDTVGDVLRAERERRGISLLMAEQNVDLSLRVADRVAVLKLGRIVSTVDSTAEGVRDHLMKELAP
jgi:branched-chain amino acid transport system ATP-binding protein